MVRYCKFFLFFYFFAVQNSVFGQSVPDLAPKLFADTIVGNTTDTSIVYIIKKPPVLVKEVVEIRRQRERKNKIFYVTLLSGLSLYEEKNIVQNGFLQYVELLNQSIKPQYAYMFGLKLRRSPKKIVMECALALTRTNQLFTYYDKDKVEYKVVNKFNYGGMTLGIGYWYKKENKVSAIYTSGLLFNNFISAIGYTYDKYNLQESTRINRTKSYVKFPVSFSGSLNFIINYKHSLVEIGPYMIFSPFSLTTKAEAYAVKRFYYGLSIGVTTKLFN